MRRRCGLLVLLTLAVAILLGAVPWLPSPLREGSDVLTLIGLGDVDPMAVCADGTAAGYYWKPGTTNTSTWIVNLEGGGWCWDEESCRERCPKGSSKHLCSSSAWPTELDLAGLLHPAHDEVLEGVNKVHVRYCTSDGHMGDNMSFGFHFRGARVLRAVFHDLVARHGLASRPSEKDLVILSGQSAGGRGAMVHLDYVQEMVSSAGGGAVDVVGFLDSPYWVDLPYSGQRGESLIEQSQSLFGYAGVAHLGTECAAAYSESEKWRCLVGQYRMPHLKTPYVLIASQYDSFQLTEIVGHKPSSSEELAYTAAFSLWTRQSLEQLHQEHPSGAGRNNTIFSWACYDHALSLTERGYDRQTCQSSTLDEAFRSFLGLLPTGEISRQEWVDVCEGFACGPGCVS